jgi:hypothetical protein
VDPRAAYSIIMRRAIACTFLFASVIASTTLAAASSSLLRVDVALEFRDHAASPLLVRQLRLETEAIWRAYRVEITWSDAAHPPADVAVAAIVERRLAGRDPAYGVGPLGRTWISFDSRVRIPIRIFCDPTERILGALTVADRVAALGHERLGDAEVGRAFGRILAHEIGHVLLAAPFHASAGLMRPQFAAVDLVVRHRDLYRLSEMEVSRLARRAQELHDGLRTVAHSADALTERCASDDPDLEPPD